MRINCWNVVMAITTTSELMQTLRLECRVGGEWQRVPLQGGDGRWSGQLEQAPGALEWRRKPRVFRASLTLAPEGDGVWGYSMEVDAPVPTRLRLTLERPGIANPFHLIPGVIFGDNNLPHAGPGHFPNLTSLQPDNVSCSPYWELRADRASLPLAILCYDGGVAAALLHRLTGREDYLVALGEGAEYEYLWRYGVRARPEAPPLKDSAWNSCGASLTSVSNAHLHPMALIAAAEFAYLAEKTGDPYHRDRLADMVQWALNSIELYPEVMGYGRLGVLSERFCPSDGLLEERYPDGTPASTWFTYNGGGAAAALEGLMSEEIR